MRTRKRSWRKITLAAAGAILLGTASFAYVTTYTGANHHPNAGKKHAMLRLEDVGMGGKYDSPEGLGKLRAVMAYLASERIPYHVAVISRSRSLGPDGVWRERGIDDPDPDPVERAFVRLLQEAQQSGGVLGMHGYTHQYGETLQPGNGQNSGTGSEFKIPGVKETERASYAAERIRSSLAAFAGAGLQPAFWESPHYRDTRAQQKVFRSHIGILYQPDLFSLRSFQDLNVHESVNGYGRDTLGSVYVPAPLKYVSDGRSVDRILKKAADWNGLAAMYFHPYMDFEFLKPVVGPDGSPLAEDGLPLYAYPENGPPSHLRRLVEGMRREGYRWLSLHEAVPYTPAHRIDLPVHTPAAHVMLGDVAGAGHADAVVRQERRILVIPGTYAWPRNRPQQAAEVWLEEAFGPDEQLFLADRDGDGKQDLFAYDRLTGELRVFRAGEGRFFAPMAEGRLPADLAGLQPFRLAGEAGTGLIASDRGRLLLIRLAAQGAEVTDTGTMLPEGAELLAGSFHEPGRDGILFVNADGGRTVSVLRHTGGGGFAAAQTADRVKLRAGGRLLTGDWNGDGLSDLAEFVRTTGVWRIYENAGEGGFRPLPNDFGPWAAGKTRTPVATDMDGNGKTDIGAYDDAEQVLDIALSFRGPTS